jgi:hypothetical protein
MPTLYPFLDNNGTICSISEVLPDPTGPPIPTLGILLEDTKKYSFVT